MPLTVFSDEYYMKQAYQEAEKALEADEIPIGAVVVCNNKIIARAHNQTDIGKVVWAADDPKNGFSRFGKMLHPKTKTETGIMRDECLALLTDFFKKKRT